MSKSNALDTNDSKEEGPKNGNLAQSSAAAAAAGETTKKLNASTTKQQQQPEENNQASFSSSSSISDNDDGNNNNNAETLEELKASFRQFSSGMNAGKKISKKDNKNTKKAKPSIEEEPANRNELTQSLHEFQAKMNAKLPQAQKKNNNNKTSSEGSDGVLVASSSRQFGSEAEVSLAEDGFLMIPKTFREDSTKDLGSLLESHSHLQLEEEPSERTARTVENDETNNNNNNENNGGGRGKSHSIPPPSAPMDDDASDGLEPLDEDHENDEDVHSNGGEQHADSITSIASFADDVPKDDLHQKQPMVVDEDDHSDGSIYEEPLAEPTPTRQETMEDLRQFHRTLSNQNLSLTSHPAGERERQDESHSNSDTDETESVEPPKMQSTNSLQAQETPKIVRPITAKHRASQLERQTEEMSKEDLISSLRAFQSQLDHKFNARGRSPATRTRQKSSKPGRHKSVEVEAPAPAVPLPRTPRRGSMIAMPKSDPKRIIQPSRSDDMGETKMSDRELEDQNFRKWFESKMEARTGDNERFILEEDDHGEGTVEDKGHGPLVVNVLHSDTANGQASPGSDDDDEDHHKHIIASQEPTNSKKWTAADRASQIKQRNSEMSRDEIKASLLQFQSQMKNRSSLVQPRKPIVPKVEETMFSSEFRLPEQPAQRVKSRLAQIEKRNETLTRDQLTKSLLAFKSNIEKKVPNDSSSSPKETKPKGAVQEKSLEKPTIDAKANNALGDKNNIRRSNNGRQDRIKMLEAEQATIPRDVMIASLQKFQVDIQGRIDASSTDVSLDSGSGKQVRKSSKLETFDATTENTSMEVTEDDFLNKVVGKTQQEEESNKTEDASRQEMMKNLLSFQTDIQGKIAKKNTVSATPVSPSQTDGASVDKKEDSGHPRKFESMLKNLEDLKKRNEQKVSTMQNLDRIRKRNEEKVSAMISALSPEEATEMPTWFAEFAQQQENKFQELVQISEQRNKEIMRLSNDSARSQVRSVSPQIDGKKTDFSQTSSLEQHEKWQRNAPASNGLDRPGQFAGYPPHEDQATADGKDAFIPISNAETRDVNVKCDEASYFIQRFAQETGLLSGKRLEERVEEVKSSIVQTGSYTQTYDEMQYGCRLAWRNCGRFIMRSAYSTLTVRDCRQVNTADDCFNQCVKHLKDVFDNWSHSPVISVFQPKEDGKSAPVRIWNRELLGYAAYKTDDGSIMGDSSNLDFTALCVKFGWTPPKVKSDFDILPLLISDETRGHDDPKVFEIPQEAIHEVELEHPDFDLFKNLNLRWCAQASDASMGIDIGGVLYQTAPFTRLYQATEISSFLLDRSRYGFAAAIAAACALKKTHLSLWRDDVQLQTQKSILNSFSRHGLRCLDHHSVSEDFVRFYSSEVQDFGSCPADWVHVVAPATSSMTGAYHQQMTNFLVKPQYLDQKPLWDDLDLTIPQPISIAAALRGNSFLYRDEKCQYDHVFVYFASETGASLRLATRLVGDFDGCATGPIPLDNLPDLLLESVKQSLVIIVTSTASSGAPPLHAKNFLGGMSQVPKGSLHSIDFAICALCNSAYTESLASFASVVEANLKRAGCVPVMGIHYVDTLDGTEKPFTDFRKKLFEENEGILYKQSPEVEPTEPKKTKPVTMTFENLVPVLKLDSIDGPGVAEGGSYLDSWERNSNVLKPSLDLFRFKLEGEEEDESRLNGLVAGDHVALYPRNMNDVVETVLRHVNTPDAVATKEFLRKSKDLSKPLSFDELSFLRDHIQGNERATSVLDEILTNSSDDSSLSVERLVQIMPPGSIPMKWILKYVPSMDPRFYSIASIDGRTKTVSIVQSVYTFEGSQKAGVASRWLRSLIKGQKVNANFMKTSFQLPHDDEGAPVVLISAGPGIAPCRTFWLSGRRNPTYLFCGCKSPEELPFSTEIDLLKKKGLLHPYIAYAHGSSSKMELEGLLRQERATLLDLLHNSRTRLYVCGSLEVDAKVRNSLAMILAQGHSRHRGVGMARAMDKLALMCQTKRYVREVYGNAIGDTRRSDPMYALWQESTVKVIRALAALEKLEVPVAPASPRKNIRQKERMNEESLAYNPIISGA